MELFELGTVLVDDVEAEIDLVVGDCFLHDEHRRDCPEQTDHAHLHLVLIADLTVDLEHQNDE